MERLKRNNLAPSQDVVSKIVTLFNRVADRPTALQVSKQVSAILQKAGYPCNENLALEAMASYKGFRSWDALAVKLPKVVKNQNHTNTTPQENTIMSTDAIQTNNRFKVGQSAFLREAVIYQGVIIASETKVTIDRVPNYNDDGRKGIGTYCYLVSMSHQGQNIELNLQEPELLTSQDLEVRHVHGDENNIHNFANEYSQDLFYVLDKWVDGFDYDAGYANARNGSLPNEQVVNFYNANDEYVELSQTIVADQDGGYTILTPPESLPKNWNSPSLPPVKVEAGTLPQDAARQVMDMFSEHLDLDVWNRIVY
jgi:hypothetical protein